MTSAMARRGVDVEVLSLVAPQPEWLQAWPAKVHGIGHTKSYYRYTNHLVPWIEKNHANYTSILIHGVWRYASFGVWRALRETSTPYFLFTHGMLDPWFQRAYPLKHIKKTLFWKMGEHRVLRDAKAVLFTCQEEMRLARQSFRPYVCREEVIGFGTALPPVDANAQLAAFLGRFPNLRNKRIILFLSRIHRKKGCDLLLRSFAKSADIDPHLQLVMAGGDDEEWSGELRRIAVECGIADRVTWTGHLGGEQ
jgi:glycosyltransferase involved in cell wall biosynthesis